MGRYALIITATGAVDNVIEYDGSAPFTLPGGAGGAPGGGGGGGATGSGSTGGVGGAGGAGAVRIYSW